MITKRSNNIIPIIRRFITSEHGENYWFNGAAGYVMECLGEKDFNYQFFAGVTGDVFAQVFSYDGYRGEGVTDYMLNRPDGRRFVENIFENCGYTATFVSKEQLAANKEMYLQTLTAYIDKGVPVLSNVMINGHGAWIVLVGYEEQGKTLLFLSDNMTQPECVSADDVFAFDSNEREEWLRGWIFVGDKKESRNLAGIYRCAICGLPDLLTVKTDIFCLGGGAFRAWADEIAGGRYDGMKPEEFDGWTMYSTYVCNGATNASCCYGFLDKAMELNPDFSFLNEVCKQYRKMADMWNQDTESLEALGGGFNVTLEVLQDKAKRGKIADKLREFADCVDEIVRVLNDGIGSIEEV